MTRLAVLVALALGLGCLPGSELGPETAGRISVTPEREPPVGDEDPEGQVEPPEPGEPRPPTGGGWTSALEGSVCELVCADVHACVLVDDPEGSAASAIELGCLDACVRARRDFVACDRPATISSSTCAPYLACARAAWPSEERPSTIVEAPVNDGCRMGCKALAVCFHKPEEAAHMCARRCQEVLDEEHQSAAGECAKHESCDAVEHCMMSLPGA